MRKFLLMALVASMALPMSAQDLGEDLAPQYIVNPGFDEDLTFNADGSTKPIINENEDKTISGRSYAKYAADSTLYAIVKTTDNSNFTRSETAATMVNGFLGHIKGWTLNTSSSGEWTYFGSAPYALESNAVGISDNTNGWLNTDIPTTKPEGADTDDNIGFIILKAGWGNSASYSQNVKLPVAQYRLVYDVINTNYANSSSISGYENLTKVICRKNVYEDSLGFNAQNWEEHHIDFTPTDSITITLGFKSSGSKGSGSNPVVVFDNIRLYKIGEASKADIIKMDLSDLDYQIGELQSNVAADYSGLYEDVDALISDVEDAMDSDDADELEAAVTKYTAAYNRLDSAYNQALAAETLLKQLNATLESTDYPGKADAQSFAETAANTISEGNADAILALPAQIQAAIIAYNQSQEASEDKPADYTYMVKHPWFVTSEAEPTYDEATGTYTFPLAETNSYTAGSAPKDGTSDGWYKGSFTDGDQRLNYVQGRACWNAWGTNFSEISVNQDITGLPSGYYKVSADLITQASYVTDQHAFAKSSLEDSNSDALTSGNWDGDAATAWTTLTTGKVLVNDGKLTIGAAGTGANGNQSGWFCATNFKLYYLGAATEEQIAAAIAKKTADAQALVDTMHYAADKAAVSDSIAAYKNGASIDVLNNGLTLGKASEAKYAEVNAEGKTLPTVSANLAGDNVYGSAQTVVKYAYDIVNGYLTGSEATYTKVDDEISKLKRYSDTYATAVHEADSTFATLTSQLGKDAVTSTIAELNKDLTAHDSIESASTVTKAVGLLEVAVAKAKMQDQYEAQAGGTDYSAYIINADAASTAGWTIEKGKGNTDTGSGQYYDSSLSSHKYFDSWAGSGLNYYGEQVIDGLPNGTYTLAAKVRTSGEGAYMFASGLAENEDTTFAEIPWKQMNITQINSAITAADGTDSIAWVSDNWGDVWADAFKAYQENPANDELSYIVNAHNGNGYGWNNLSIENIVVKDHKMVIGMTTDSARFNNTKLKTFKGSWFSIVDFTLTQTAAGDNTGWGGPVTGIKAVEVETPANAADGIYTIDGVQVSNISKPGLYILVKDGKAKKVLVK